MKVQELLDKPEKWTQNAYARDEIRRSVHYEDPFAVCFCLIGAVRKCYPIILEREAIEAEIDSELKCWGFNWNDAPERTFEDIKNLVEKLDI